jgi:hypothetical protein
MNFVTGETVFIGHILMLKLKAKEGARTKVCSGFQYVEILAKEIL